MHPRKLRSLVLYSTLWQHMRLSVCVVPVALPCRRRRTTVRCWDTCYTSPSWSPSKKAWTRRGTVSLSTTAPTAVRRCTTCTSTLSAASSCRGRLDDTAVCDTQCTYYNVLMRQHQLVAPFHQRATTGTTLDHTRLGHTRLGSTPPDRTPLDHTLPDRRQLGRTLPDRTPLGRRQLGRTLLGHTRGRELRGRPPID